MLNAKTIMINSGIINGIPVHSSYQILTDLLRNQLGFECDFNGLGRHKQAI